MRALALVPLLSILRLGAQTPEAEVQAAFQAFVEAQNRHDLKTVGTLLLEGPDFLWVTRGTALWGREAALERFAQLYQGTWHLDPDDKGYRIVLKRPGVISIFLPIRFTMAPTGQPAQDAPFLMNQTWVQTPGGWKLGSLLPIPAPPPRP